MCGIKEQKLFEASMETGVSEMLQEVDILITSYQRGLLKRNWWKSDYIDIQEQLLDDVLQNRCSWKFRNIHRKILRFHDLNPSEISLKKFIFCS